MIGYKPVAFSSKLGQAPPVASVAIPSPPDPDMVFTGFTGLPGALETVAVLTVTGTAAWLGLRTATETKANSYLRIAGWVGGIGSAAIALLYFGSKIGLTEELGLPAIRVSPA